MSDIGDNSVAADELRGFVEEFERLEAEKKERTGEQTELLKEAKSRGYEPKIMRKLIALRKMDPDKLAEE